MPSHHHAIPNRRARAIRAIAENSAPPTDAGVSVQSSSAPTRSDAISTQSDAVPALTDEAAVLGLMDLDWVDTAF